MRRNIREMPAAAWVLFAGTFVNRFGSFVLPFLLLYLRHRGYSIQVAGLVTGAYGVGGLMASLVGGYLADRFGRRNSIAASMFGSALSMLALSQAVQLPALVAASIAAGLTSEAYRPASSALLADLVKPTARVTAFALLRFAINLGFAIGPAVAGFLADHSFTFLFIGDALTSATFGVLALAALPEGMRTAQAAESPSAAGYAAVLRDRIFLVFLIATLALSFVYLQSETNFALAVREAGFSNATYGYLLSLNGLLIIIVELPIASITQRLPARPVIALGILLEGIGFGVTGFALTLPALAVTVAVWTLGETVTSPVGAAYVAALAPAHLRGRYNGAWGLMWALASVLAPSAGALLFVLAPHGLVLWLLCGALSFAAAALMISIGPQREARAAPAP